MNKNFIDDLRRDGKSEDGSRETKRRDGRGRRPYLWIGVGVVVIVLIGVMVSTMRATATVKVTPVQQVVTVDHIIAAYEKGTEGAGIPFERVSVTSSEKVSVPSTGVRNVSEKAKGTLLVKNTSDKVQRFVAKTRFKSPKGEIYRTQSAIVIPAGTSDAPGTVDATVIADNPGAGANADAGTQFTVPGLSGGALYSQVTATAKEAITGGFVGAMKTASPSDIASAEDKVKSTLATALAEQVKTTVSGDSILYDDASFVTYESVRTDTGGGDEYTENVTGTLTGLLFTKEALAEAIADRTTTELASSSVEAIDLEKLTMRILGRSSIDPKTDSRFSFSLQGSVKLVWLYDSKALVQSLLGVARDRYQEVFRRFPTIERAEATFKPKWRQTFPTNPEKITIETIVNP